jgi:hypothetical protein
MLNTKRLAQGDGSISWGEGSDCPTRLNGLTASDRAGRSCDYLKTIKPKPPAVTLREENLR